MSALADPAEVGVRLSPSLWLERLPRPAGRPQPSLLHILNGDCAADRLRESGAPGRITLSADVLCEGPAPAGLAPERWRKMRARYLAESGYGDYDDCLARLSEWDRALDDFRSYDEVVLWFEHDLFDQVLLVRLLDWFARQELGWTKLSLVSIGEYPGIHPFHGLGQLTAEQMGGLLESRVPVSAAQRLLARHAWRLFCSPEPIGLELLLRRDTAALPFLAGALHRLLEEFPAVGNGLSRTEQQTLEALVIVGPMPFEALFRAVQWREERPFMGDSSFLRFLRELAVRPRPLLRIEPGANESMRALAVRLTPTGLAVLEGREDWVRIHGVDRWLGGVHLHGAEAAWRWDPRRGRLISPPLL
jgi:uncharacterized protein DUF1835